MDIDAHDDGLHLDKHEDLDDISAGDKKSLGKPLNRVSRAWMVSVKPQLTSNQNMCIQVPA
jgi:hypothetical protein